MSLTSLQVGASFLVSTGDNFYTNNTKGLYGQDHSGVDSVYDPFWKSKFSNVSTGAGVQLPIYAVLGNHGYGKYDQVNPGFPAVHKTSAAAQIEFSRMKIDPRWNMPDHNLTNV